MTRGPLDAAARRRATVLGGILGLLLLASGLRGETVAVHHPESAARGLLSVYTLNGTRLAEGVLTQTTNGMEVTTEAVLHFGDGSLQDETAVFSQQGHFRLIRDHLVQQGPAFPRRLDMMVDAAAGRVIVRTADTHGRNETYDERLEMPADVANGLIAILLKNVTPAAHPQAVSLVVATPKPRLVRLAIDSAGSEEFRSAHAAGRAAHFVIKAEIGGVAGVFAGLLGKQPPDSHVWILQGAAPRFVRAEEPFYPGAPLWRIDLTPAPPEERREP